MDIELLEELRERERKEEIRAALRVCCSKMSLPLYMAFWFADLIYEPQLKWEFLALRSLMIPICLLIFYGVTRARTLEQVENICLFFAFANSSLITIMIYRTEGVRSPYYAGLNLVAVGILAFFPWSRKKLPLAVMTVFLPYYAYGLFLWPDEGELVSLGLNTYFIIGNVVVSLVKHHFTEELRKNEIQSRLKLQYEIASRETIIREKTHEALNLSLLTKHFSPQVVQAIRSGKLNLSAGSHRSDICAIFVDIVNSTDHVVKIDINKISAVLSMFMEDTMKVLLKYDITIDKFLGDGVLAFSNAPVHHDDFIERVVNAALEIRARIANRRPAYMEHWMNELQIRVGIATGCANVGFYGSDEYFKSYTAIGGVVNLASRLCAAAPPDSIWVCPDVARRLETANYNVKLIGTPFLKGFESESIMVYEVLENGSATAGNEEIHVCPNHHGVLHLDNSELGIYVLKCRECDYVMDGERLGGAERHTGLPPPVAAAA
jgi:class 3 adenylate cyclase